MNEQPPANLITARDILHEAARKLTELGMDGIAMAITFSDGRKFLGHTVLSWPCNDSEVPEVLVASILDKTAETLGGPFINTIISRMGTGVALNEGESLDPLAPTIAGKVWKCEIGPIDEALLPDGADLPMRQAVAQAFEKMTGREPEAIYSGWGGPFSPANARDVVALRRERAEQQAEAMSANDRHDRIYGDFGDGSDEGER